MGGICSKSSNKDDSFTGPGRVLGASTQSSAPRSAPVPKTVTSSSTPGRTLGSRDGASSPNDAKSAAAKAAEARAAQASKGTGKLATQLAAQKKQTRNEVLNSASESERRARDADQSAEARNWN